MRRFGFAMAVLLLGALGTVPVSALTIKLGSLAPSGSPWELGLKRMAAEWETDLRWLDHRQDLFRRGCR